MSTSSTDRVMGSTGGKYEAVFTDKKDNSEMNQMDFIKLMVAQMQNQDFTNPTDNSEMIQQMATFSNMQMMQEMANYSKTNYALSLVGKNVTATRFNVSGNLDTATGMVEKVSLVDNEFVVYVGGKKYTLDQIMSVEGASGSSSGGIPGVNPQNFKLEASNIGTNSTTVSWNVPTEDTAKAANLKYSVYYSKESKFNSVEDVEKGTLVGMKDVKNLKTQDISGLDPDTTYYVNVVVTDENGNKAVYQPVTVTTKFA